ncbi:VOC family protein [Chitinibacter fontanus]|uniref:VOC family protein n=1 Tax=Chitinibacter fontanus TaxID=1737446 RepID=UPI001D141F0C|nr:VOC family protein [Chitinibacter fontanus]
MLKYTYNQPTQFEYDLAGYTHRRCEMQFGYTIIYVSDVAASLGFFERAFGFSLRFLHESGQYGELETGATTLAFAQQDLAHSHFAGGVLTAQSATQPLGVEIALVTTAITEAHQQAIAHGASELAAPA